MGRASCDYNGDSGDDIENSSATDSDSDDDSIADYTTAEPKGEANIKIQKESHNQSATKIQTCNKMIGTMNEVRTNQ